MNKRNILQYVTASFDIVLATNSKTSEKRCLFANYIQKDALKGIPVLPESATASE